jgi:predicted nucleic acid-binding protein
MTVHLDTSVLIDALAGPRPLLTSLINVTERGDRPVISTIVLYEWLRGPRTRADLVVQEDMFPRAEAVPFGVLEADMAAKLYTRVRRARAREFDIAVAACAIVHGGALWTVNRDDFKDIPDLRLV